MNGLRLLFWTLLLPFLSVSQALDPDERQRTMSWPSDSIGLDSLSVYPPSIRISTLSGPNSSVAPLPSTSFFFNFKTGKLWIDPAAKPGNDAEISLQYIAIPYDISAPVVHKDTSLLNIQMLDNRRPNVYEVEGNEATFEPFDGLDKNGSISRGVTVGNRQDLVLNSSLDLQLSGRLNENTYLRASITDDNVPIQADGYTQQLQEFDRAYIELENDQLGKIVAGDYEISAERFRFMPFYKKLSGATYEKKNSQTGMEVRASAALSRGQFARNVFFGIEGNQGPYRLTGNNNEAFIIIVSGSERVFIDGQPMTRGQNYDYVINYNSGEITFTALQQITNVKRIVVEFQYTDQSYGRSLLEAEVAQTKGTWQWAMGVYSEQDARNQNLQQDLTNEEKQYLASIGDNLEEALVPAFDSVGYVQGEVRYALRDSLGVDSVFVYSTDPDEAYWRVSFTNVGAGNGDYILSDAAINGRVFEWVPPIGGISQGSYAPLKQINTPRRLQMASGGLSWNSGDPKKAGSTSSKIGVQGSIRRYDPNTFSELDSEDDVGGAVNVYAEQKWSNGWNAGVDYEYVQNNFQPIQRFRSVEFQRDWNVSDTLAPGDQHYVTANAGYRKTGVGGLNYALQFLNNGPEYSGFRNNLLGDVDYKGTLVNVSASWLESDNAGFNSRFIRQKTHFRQYYKWLKFGLRGESEFNEKQDLGGDSLQSGSYRFDQWEFFLGNNDSLANGLEFTYFNRTDYARSGEDLSPTTLANAFTLDGRVAIGRTGTIRTGFTYRLLDNLNDTVNPLDRTLTGRFQYRQRLWRNAVNLTTFYESGSGQEARREFTYVEVAAGQGVYAWIDYNDNGVQELDEFEIAEFPSDAKYIRVFRQSDEFVRTNFNKFSQVVLLNPAAIWGSKDDVRKLLSKFAIQTTYNTERKTQRGDLASSLNPFSPIDFDSTLVGLNQGWRNTLFFQRSRADFGADYTWSQNQSRNLVSYGFESQRTREHQFQWRWMFLQNWIWNSQVVTRNRANQSEGFDARSYSFDEQGTEQKITFQPGRRWKLSFIAGYKTSLNDSELNEALDALNAGLEFNYNVASKALVTAQINFIQNEYTGADNTPVAYAILEGLQPGNNATWTATLQSNIAKHLQLNLLYDGRVSEGNNAIHTGSVQLKAFF
jgi:hypothetical protein